MATSGMDAATGAPLAGLAHLRQSIRDILTTRIGTRVFRREYGSTLPELIDRPQSPELLVDIYAGVAQALAKWEPRVRLNEVRIVSAGAGGALVLDLDMTYLPDGEEVTVDGVVVE